MQCITQRFSKLDGEVEGVRLQLENAEGALEQAAAEAKLDCRATIQHLTQVEAPSC